MKITNKIKNNNNNNTQIHKKLTKTDNLNKLSKTKITKEKKISNNSKPINLKINGKNEKMYKTSINSSESKK